VSNLVVVGSVNADLVVRVPHLPAAGETVSGGTFERHDGGKSANQAVAAARLGARVAFVGAVGADDLGADAVAALEREGVDCSGVTRLDDAPTGVALIIVDEAGENQIAVASGSNARLDAAMVRSGVPAAGPAARGMAEGAAPGVVLLGLEVSDEAVLAGARVAAAAGARLVLNPAPARRLPDELLDLGPILTPNEAEARALAGEADAESAARALEARTGAPVVVTLGARGALVGGELIAPPQVHPVDTTGAGDTFSGALAGELATGAELHAATRFATAAAGLSTQAAGARGAMPARAAVEAALR
jgi:ribokinase